VEINLMLETVAVQATKQRMAVMKPVGWADLASGLMRNSASILMFITAMCVSACVSADLRFNLA